MARKKVAGPMVHLLDKTIGNELNIEDLMCGSTVGGLKRDDIAVDPADSRMPEICDVADTEGRMCPGCKRCVTYYAKGLYLGKMRERQCRTQGVLSSRDH
jgi:hypothetical protein